MVNMQTVIFDLGGVLIDWNPRYLYEKMFDSEEDIDYFLSNIATSDWNEEQDAGRSLAEATELLLRQYPDPKWEEPIKAFYGRWPEMLGGAIEGTVNILKKCIDNPNLRVYALTNWSAETWPIALKEFEFLHWFEGVLVSGAEGMRKPAPEFYQLMMDRFEIDKGTAVFIDDNKRNVDASNAFGLKAVLFRDPEQLEEELKEVLGTRG
jgi:2-haloacid dehalogenase